mgnify:CR=1 FL=1
MPTEAEIAKSIDSRDRLPTELETTRLLFMVLTNVNEKIVSDKNIQFELAKVVQLPEEQVAEKENDNFNGISANKL